MQGSSSNKTVPANTRGPDSIRVLNAAETQTRLVPQSSLVPPKTACAASVSTIPVATPELSPDPRATIPLASAIYIPMHAPESAAAPPTNTQASQVTAAIEGSPDPTSPTQILPQPNHIAPILQSLAMGSNDLSLPGSTVVPLTASGKSLPVARSIETSPSSTPSIANHVNPVFPTAESSEVAPNPGSGGLAEDSSAKPAANALPDWLAARTITNSGLLPFLADSFSVPAVLESPSIRSPLTPVKTQSSQTPSASGDQPADPAAGSAAALPALDMSTFSPTSVPPILSSTESDTKSSFSAKTNPPTKATETRVLNPSSTTFDAPSAGGGNVTSSNPAPSDSANAHVNPADQTTTVLPAAGEVSTTMGTTSHALAHHASLAFGRSGSDPLPNQADQPSVLQMPGDAPNATLQNLPAPNTTSNGAPVPTKPAASPSVTTPQGTIQSAQLVDGGVQSEMHIELNTRAFGNVEVHALVRDSQVGLSIGGEHGDLRSWLAPEVPALQAILKREDLHFGATPFLGANTGDSAGREGSPPGRSPNHLPRAMLEIDNLKSDPGEMRESASASGSCGLSIHA